MSSEWECEAKEDAVSDTLSFLMEMRIVLRIQTAVSMERLLQGTEVLVLAISKPI